MSSRSSSAHSCAADAGHSTLTVLDPRQILMWIGVSVGRGASASGTKLALCSAGSLDTTGASATASVPVRSASTTQRRSRFAFSPRESAAAAIDTPGRRQAATDSALNAALWRRRRRRPMLAASTEVSTCPPICYVDTYAPISQKGSEGEFASRLPSPYYSSGCTSLAASIRRPRS